MATLSSQFASISPGMDTDTAQSGLVSIMKAFDVEVEDVERNIMDNINTLGNRFAESNLDIVQGLERSAAALHATGTTLEESLALFTGGQEILQNPEKMGTALRSISMRIRGYNEETEELDEELSNITGDLIDLTKTVEHAQGVSIFKEGSTTEFKSLLDYLREVSEIWDEMTDKQQNDFLQKAFAKTQAQAGAAILQNFDQVDQALQEMQDAAGSADREMAIITDSIDYKLNTLKETWVGVVQGVVDRGDLGDIVDFLTAISNGVSTVVENLGLLGTVLTSGGITSGIVLFKKFYDTIQNEIIPATIAATKQISSVAQFNQKTTSIDAYIKSLQGLTAKEQQYAITHSGLNLSLQESILSRMEENAVTDASIVPFSKVSQEKIKELAANKALTENSKELALERLEEAYTTNGLNIEILQRIAEEDTLAGELARSILLESSNAGAIGTSTAAQELYNKILKERILLELKQKAIKILTNPLTWVAAGVAGIITADKQIKKFQKDLQKTVSTSGDSFKRTSEEIDSYKNEIKELQNTISDSSTSYEEAKSARERLLEIQDELISKYGDEDEKIRIITSSIDGQIEALDRLSAKEWEETKRSLDAEEIKGWGLGFKLSNGLSLDATNTEMVLAQMQDLDRTINGTAQDYAILNETASKFGLDISNDLETGLASIKLTGESADDLSDKLRTIRSYLEDQGASNSLLREIDQQIGALDDLIDNYGTFYKQYVLNERILGNATYEESYQEITKAYQQYRDARTKGDEEDAQSYKDAIITSLQDVQTALDEDTSLQPFEKASILSFFKELYPDLQKEVGTWELKADIYVDADSKQLSDTGKEIQEKILAFDNEENLVHQVYESGGELEGFYDDLDRYATDHGMTVQELINLYRELGLLQGFSYGSSDKLANAYGKGRGIDISSDSRKSQYTAITNASDKLGLEDYNTALAFTPEQWKKVDEEVRKVSKSTDTDEERANNYAKAIQAVAEEWRTVQAEVEEVGDKTHTSAEKALDSLQFTDPEDSSKTISGSEKLDNYYSTVSSIQEAIQKLNNGQLSTAEISKLRVQYDLTSDSIEGMTNELKDYAEVERDASLKMIDDAIEAHKEDEELVATLKEAKKLAIDYYNEMAGYKSPINVGVASINDIQNLQSGMDMIEKIYQDIQNKGEFDWSSIINNVEFENAFKSCGFAYDEFIQKVKGAPTDIKATQKAFDKLVTQFQRVNSSLYGLKKEDAKAAEKMLTDQGIINAKDLVSWELGSQDIQKEIDSLYELAKARKEARLEEVNSIDDYQRRTQAIDEVNQKYDEDIANLGEESEALKTATADQKAYYAAKLFSEFDFTSGDIEQLKSIVKALGLGVDAWVAYYSASQRRTVTQADAMAAAKAGMSAYDYVAKQQAEQAKAAQQKILDEINNLGKVGGGAVYGPKNTNSAGSAGKEAADAYVEAYEKELAELQRLRDSGAISEKEYLDAMRALYEKYFKNITKYAKNFQDAQKEYLSGMKSLYDSVLSGIISHIDKQISALQDQKQAAVDALTAEKEAALAVYDAQLKAIDETIKAKNKEIAGIQKEIDAINEAAEARKRNLELQRNLYELERAQTQRTNLIYKNGQLVYEQDTSNIRDSKEALEDTKREIEVAQLEKQISLIEDQIDQLEEEKEAIQAMRDETEAYYDKLIEETEAYWDALIKSMEDYKSRWEELQELQEEAQFRANLKDLGFDLDAILNMDEGQFAKFKEEYVGIIADMYEGNESMTNALAEVLGTSADQLGSYLESTAGQTQNMVDALNNLGTPLDQMADSFSAVQKVLEAGFKFDIDDTGVMKLSSMADEAKEAAEAVPEAVAETINNDTVGHEAMDKYGHDLVEFSFKEKGLEVNSPSHTAMEATESVPEGVVETLNTDTTAEAAADKFGHRITDKLKESIETGINGMELNLSSIFPEDMDLSTLTSQFSELADAIKLVADALGIGESGTVGSLSQAIQDLNALSLGADGAEGIITQFTALKDAVDKVTSAIGGAGGESGGTQGGAATGGAGGQGGEGEGGSTGSLTSAIDELKTKADEAIGTVVAEEGGEGDGTVIGDFGALTTTVNKTAEAIGTADSDESTEDLIGSVTAFGIKDHEVLVGGEEGEGVIGDWVSFNEQLSEAEDHITKMVEGLENLQDAYDTTLTVTLEIEGGGEYTGTATVNGGHARYSFNVLEAIGLPHEGGEWSNILGRGGKAKFSGTANFGGNWGFEGGKTMIAEIGPEVVVTPDGRYTVYDKPQIVDLPKNSIIFNHLQSQEILNPGNQVKKIGKSNAQGTFPNGIVPLSQADPEQFNFLLQAAETLKANTQDMMADLSNINYATDDISRAVQNITNHNNSSATNITFGDLHFTCTGITSSEVMNQVGDALQREFQGLALNAYQRAMAH